MKKLLLSLVASLLTVTASALSPINMPFIYQSALPVGIPSSGSMANNGALSGVTAFSTTYPAIYLFFDANTICTVGTGGNAAGFYYTQMSSTSAGTVFNNVLAAGSRPVLLASPTAFACTGPGAYTQVLTPQNLITFNIPGGFLGAGGGVQIYDLFSLHNSGNGKVFNITFGGSGVQAANVTTANAYENLLWVNNTGTQSRQVLSPLTPTAFGPYTTANAFLSINTSTNFSIIANATLTNAAEYIVLEAFIVWALPQGS